MRKFAAVLAAASAPREDFAAPTTVTATVVDESFVFSEVKYKRLQNGDMAFAGTFHINFREAGNVRCEDDPAQPAKLAVNAPRRPTCVKGVECGRPPLAPDPMPCLPLIRALCNA